jgi:hypothetical protein
MDRAEHGVRLLAKIPHEGKVELIVMPPNPT